MAYAVVASFVGLAACGDAESKTSASPSSSTSPEQRASTTTAPAAPAEPSGPWLVPIGDPDVPSAADLVAEAQAAEEGMEVTIKPVTPTAEERSRAERIPALVKGDTVTLDRVITNAARDGSRFVMADYRGDRGFLKVAWQPLDAPLEVLPNVDDPAAAGMGTYRQDESGEVAVVYDHPEPGAPAILYDALSITPAGYLTQVKFTATSPPPGSTPTSGPLHDDVVAIVEDALQ